MYFLLKIVIFHCYVSLPEGTQKNDGLEDMFPFKKWRHFCSLCYYVKFRGRYQESSPAKSQLSQS